MTRWIPPDEDRHHPGPPHHRSGHRPPHFMLAEGISHLSEQLERIARQLETMQKQLDRA